MPSSTLDAQWNLILWACEPCNRRKAELEDDISAITMQPDSAGRFAATDTRLKNAAERKAKRSFSRRTRKSVEESREKIDINGHFGAASFTLGFVSPPQIDPERIRELSHLHAMAFFYFVTFKSDLNQGHFWRGSFLSINEAYRSDWGNDLQISFADQVVHWEPRIFGASADGFFKIAIRKKPDRDMWSLALEWNCKLRIIAAFGDVDSLNEFSDALPRLHMEVIVQGAGNYIRYREEIPLATEDVLFLWEDEKLGSPE